jgi:hypothetical protein
MSVTVYSAVFTSGNAAIGIGNAVVVNGNASALTVGTQVYLFPIGPNESGSVPTPFALNTPFWISVNNGGSIQLSAAKGGGVITPTSSGVCGIASAQIIGYDNSGNAVFSPARARPPTNVPLPFQSYAAQSISIGAAKTGANGNSQVQAPPGNAPATITKPHNNF